MHSSKTHTKASISICCVPLIDLLLTIKLQILGCVAMLPLYTILNVKPTIFDTCH
jgi:hypothetical protein